MGNIGPLELVVVLVIALVVLGPKRLPEVGKSLGRGMREFKDGIAGLGQDPDDEDEERRQTPTREVSGELDSVQRAWPAAPRLPRLLRSSSLRSSPRRMPLRRPVRAATRSRRRTT